ncbi:MAG: hypothetical protein MJH10_12355 [Epibacterium sp.]|nr:hypothetical protein [Epibacterium sp.]
MDGQTEVSAGCAINQGKITVAEASRTYDLAPAGIETWIDGDKIFQNYRLDHRGLGMRAPDAVV